MSAEPVRYFDRAKKIVETEQVYGEAWLRWTYESAPGGLALHALFKRSLVSRLYGWRMSRAIWPLPKWRRAGLCTT